MFPGARGQAGKYPYISLFSGIGGLDLALAKWIYPVAYVECDGFCQSILKLRMSEGLLHHGPVFPDVQDFHGGDLPAAGVAGGFPCQGVSTAGKQLGLSDARTGLLSHVFRIYDSLPADRREFMVLENVASILHRKSEMREIILFMVKACKSRGLTLHWASTCLDQVGLAAFRGRVFFFAHF
ncbi:unnamed protein product [Durusdinium trenchii]